MTNSVIRNNCRRPGGRPPFIRDQALGQPVSPYFALAIDRWRRLLISYGGSYSQTKGLVQRWHYRGYPFVGMYRIDNQCITEIDLSHDTDIIKRGD